MRHCGLDNTRLISRKNELFGLWCQDAITELALQNNDFPPGTFPGLMGAEKTFWHCIV